MDIRRFLSDCPLKDRVDQAYHGCFVRIRLDSELDLSPVLRLGLGRLLKYLGYLVAG